MSVITEEQRIELEASSRFQAVCKQYVKFIATYLKTLSGSTESLGGRTPEQWARQRLIAAAVVFNPNNQQYSDWAAQMCMLLKGQDVWQTDVDTTITAMIGSGKFEELANQTYETRGSILQF